jgi:hypothetical protein
VTDASGGAAAAYEPPRRRGVRSNIADAISVVANAGRLVLRHWPVLFAVAFAGQAAHQLGIEAAVRATEVGALLGYFVVVLVPITTLTAILLMLRAVRPSLPGVTAAIAGGSSADARRDSALDHVGSLLIPFLAVYTMSGYLVGDMLEYGGGVAEAAVQQGRYLEFLPEGPVLIAIIAITFALRWVQSRWEGGRRRAWLGIVGAYLEVIWITSVILIISELKPWEWVAERRAVHWLVAGWHQTVDRLGPLNGPAEIVTSWLGSLWGSVAAVLAAPLAWFVVGAVAYGYRLAPIPAPNRALYERLSRGWAAVPQMPRKALLAITNDIRERFGPMVQGMRMFTRIGVPAMVVFCLAFVAVRLGTVWDWGGGALFFELERLVVGPQDLVQVWIPLQGIVGHLINAVVTVLLVCVLAAAVDRVLLAYQVEQPPAPHVREPSAERTPAGVHAE